MVFSIKNEGRRQMKGQHWSPSWHKLVWSGLLRSSRLVSILFPHSYKIGYSRGMEFHVSRSPWILLLGLKGLESSPCSLPDRVYKDIKSNFKNYLHMFNVLRGNFNYLRNLPVVSPQYDSFSLLIQDYSR